MPNESVCDDIQLTRLTQIICVSAVSVNQCQAQFVNPLTSAESGVWSRRAAAATTGSQQPQAPKIIKQDIYCQFLFWKAVKYRYLTNITTTARYLQ